MLVIIFNVWRKEGNVLFNDALKHILFTVIRRQTCDKGLMFEKLISLVPKKYVVIEVTLSNMTRNR